MCNILCNNIFCVYWNNDCCILQTITHDALGVCTQGIHVDMEEDFLEKKRVKMLEKLYKDEKIKRG